MEINCSPKKGPEAALTQHKIRSGSGKTKPKKVRFANFRERSPKLVPEPPFAYKCYTKPLKRGVPEQIRDSFPERSRTSLSSVWFAGATPDSALGRWGRTQMGSDRFSRILTGFYLLDPTRVRPVPSETHDFKGLRQDLTGFLTGL